jgi:hypothetical protein
MPKATPHYNLLTANPDLVKEWHPTKNIGVKPGELTPGSVRKVWWICSAGHEWEATVYSRSRGRCCPFCRRRTKNDAGYLALAKPNLIKDWHPTKNGALNPRNVPSNHPKKVWWICTNSHEWEDTIKNRIQGKGCPECEKNFVRKITKLTANKGHRLEPMAQSSSVSAEATVFFKEDFSETNAKAESRSGIRYPLKATAILEDRDSGHWIYAQMNNFSNDGMYFETEVALKPGTKIIIKFDKPIFPHASKKLTSVVRWCRDLAEDYGAIPSYGLGVEFIQPGLLTP